MNDIHPPLSSFSGLWVLTLHGDFPKTWNLTIDLTSLYLRDTIFLGPLAQQCMSTLSHNAACLLCTCVQWYCLYEHS